MNPVRMIVLGVALIAGMACVAILARGMASSHDRSAPAPPPPHPTVQVLVAKHELNVGDRLSVDDISWQAWPAEAMNPAYITDGAGKSMPPGQNLSGAASKVASVAKAAITDPSQGPASVVFGALVRERIQPGEPILQSKLVHAGSAGVMAVTLDPGMRAMALPLSAESAAGGFILPGDHVDVVLSRQLDAVAPAAGGSPTPSKVFSARTVLNNVRVLAIDQNNSSPQKGAAEVGATATVEVTPAEAEDLVVAKAAGSLTFVLRSYADAAGPATRGDAAGNGRDSNANVVRIFTPNASSSVMVSR